MDAVINVVVSFLHALLAIASLSPTSQFAIGLYVISVVLWLMAWWGSTLEDLVDPLMRAIYRNDR